MPQLMAPTVGPNSNVGQRFNAPQQDVSGIAKQRVAAATDLQRKMTGIAESVLQLRVAARTMANEAMVTDYVNRYEQEAKRAISELKTKSNLDAIDAVPEVHKLLEDNMQRYSKQLQGRDTYVQRSFAEKAQQLSYQYRNAADAYGMEQSVKYRDTERANQLVLKIDNYFAAMGTAQEGVKRAEALTTFGQVLDDQGIAPNSDTAKVMWQAQTTKAHTTRADNFIELNQFGMARNTVNNAYALGELSAQVRSEYLAKIIGAEEVYSEKMARKNGDGLERYEKMSHEEQQAFLARTIQKLYDAGAYSEIKDPALRQYQIESEAKRQLRNYENQFNLEQAHQDNSIRLGIRLAQGAQGDSMLERMRNGLAIARQQGEYNGIPAEVAETIFSDVKSLGSEQAVNDMLLRGIEVEPVDTSKLMKMRMWTEFGSGRIPLPYDGDGKIDSLALQTQLRAMGFAAPDMMIAMQEAQTIAKADQTTRNALFASAKQVASQLDDAIATAKTYFDSHEEMLPEQFSDFFSFDGTSSDQRTKEKFRRMQAVIDFVLSEERESLKKTYGKTPQELDSRLRQYSRSNEFFEAVASRVGQVMADQDYFDVDGYNWWTTHELQSRNLLGGSANE